MDIDAVPAKAERMIEDPRHATLSRLAGASLPPRRRSPG